MKKTFKQTIAVFIALLLPFQGVGIAPAFAQSALVGAQTAPSMVTLSPVFTPAVLRGLKVDPQNPFHFNFVLDNGQSKLAGENLKNEGTKLIKYFLASLTLPENDLWVNLSPYEKDRIITNEFGQTEMGRQLLSEDYLLKKLSASLLHPDAETGKKFWDKVRKITAQKLGTTDAAIDTFNRIWIMPDKAVVYQDQGTAFIGETHLKVLMEEDYVALAAQKAGAGSPSAAGTGRAPARGKSEENASTDIFRDEVLPIIEKEVNEGENFASLRQIYHSLILASWYKRTLKQSLLSQVYVDQKKVAGVESDDKEAKEKIYEQYLETFKRGVYNLIREEQDAATGEMIPRKYFSGGVTLLVSSAAIETRPLSAASSVKTGDLSIFDTNARGFNASASNSAVTDLLGSDLMEAFVKINGGKAPVVYAAQGSLREIRDQVNVWKSEKKPDDELIVMSLGVTDNPVQNNLLDKKIVQDTRRILVGKRGEILSNPYYVLIDPSAIRLEQFDLVLDYSVFPAEKLIHLDKFSLGRKSSDQNIDTNSVLRDQGFAQGIVDRLAAEFRRTSAGYSLVSVPIGTANGQVTRALGQLQKKFDLKPVASESAEWERLKDLGIFDPVMNGKEVYSGQVPTILDADASAASSSVTAVLKTSIGNVNVRFNYDRDKLVTNPEMDPEAVLFDQFDFLIFVVSEMVKNGIISSSEMAAGNNVAVEPLKTTGLDRLFLMTVDRKKYVVKAGRFSEYEEYIRNEWDILQRLNPDGSRPDIVKPVFHGNRYLVTEYLEGNDLSEVVALQRKGPFNTPEVVQLGLALADTVAYIHEKGVVIRDLNPDNIRIFGDGKVALYDFNVSMQADYDWDHDPYLLRPSAPSSWNVEDRGVPAQERIKPDVMSDVFSVGMTLLRASINTFYWAQDINMEQALGDVKSKNPELEKIVRKATGPRETRYKNIAQLKADLAILQQQLVDGTIPAGSSAGSSPLTQADFLDWEEFADFFTSNNGVSPSGWWIGFDVDNAGTIQGDRAKEEVFKKLSTALLRQVAAIDGAALFKTSQTQKRYFAEEGYVFLPDSLSRSELQEKLDAIRTEFNAQTAGSNKYPSQTMTFAVLPSRDIESAAVSKYGTTREEEFLDPGLRWQRVVTKVLNELLREAKDDTAKYGDKTVFYPASSAVSLPAVEVKRIISDVITKDGLEGSATTVERLARWLRPYYRLAEADFRAVVEKAVRSSYQGGQVGFNIERYENQDWTIQKAVAALAAQNVLDINIVIYGPGARNVELTHMLDVIYKQYDRSKVKPVSLPNIHVSVYETSLKALEDQENVEADIIDGFQDLHPEWKGKIKSDLYYGDLLDAERHDLISEDANIVFLRNTHILDESYNGNRSLSVGQLKDFVRGMIARITDGAVIIAENGAVGDRVGLNFSAVIDPAGRQDVLDKFAASSAVNDVIKTPAGDINVEFKDVIGYFTSKDRTDRKVIQQEIPYLRTILTKLIENGAPAGVSAEGGAQMTVQSLYANISNRLFLVNWGGKKFVIKSAQGNYYNDQLKTEAAILNRLNPGPDHPRADIAKVVLTGEEPLEIVSGMNPARAYMVTDYIEGQDLSVILGQRASLNDQEVVKLGLQLADAMGYAHDNGIVIRDVRPHNIRMKPDGTIALFDFNVSMLPDYDWDKDPNKIRYSLRYNWEAEDRGAYPPLRERPDILSDIFSIGMTLLQARVHMIGLETESQVRWMFGSVENLQLENIIAKAVGPRYKRYQNTAELKADLVALQQSLSEGKVAASSAVEPLTQPEIMNKAFLRHEQYHLMMSGFNYTEKKASLREAIDAFKAVDLKELELRSEPNPQFRVVIPLDQIAQQLIEAQVASLPFEVAFSRVRGSDEWLVIMGSEKSSAAPGEAFDINLHNHPNGLSLPSWGDLESFYELYNMGLIRFGIITADGIRFYDVSGAFENMPEGDDLSYRSQYMNDVFNRVSAEEKAKGVDEKDISIWVKFLEAVQHDGNIDIQHVAWNDLTPGHFAPQHSTLESAIDRMTPNQFIRSSHRFLSLMLGDEASGLVLNVLAQKWSEKDQLAVLKGTTSILKENYLGESNREMALGFKNSQSRVVQAAVQLYVNNDSQQVLQKALLNALDLSPQEREEPGRQIELQQLLFDLKSLGQDGSVPGNAVLVSAADELSQRWGITPTASSAVRNVVERMTTPEGDIAVNFKVSDVKMPQLSRKGQIFSSDTSPLKSIVSRFINQEFRINAEVPQSKNINVESLAVTEIDRLFLVTWGSRKYVIKVANPGRNNFLYNEWEILAHLNTTDAPRTDIVKPLFVGQEFWINESDLSRQKLEYIVTNYLEGNDLSDLIRRKPLTVPEVLDLGIELADTVGYVHSREVSVRDLKPNNIRILPDGRAALFDFNASVSDDYDWGEDRYELRWLEVSGWTAEDRRVALDKRQKPDSLFDIYAIGMTLLRSAIPASRWVDDIKQGDAFADQVAIGEMLKNLGEKNPDLKEIISKAIGPREKRYKNTAELKADLTALQQSMSAGGVAASSALKDLNVIQMKLELPSNKIDQISFDYLEDSAMSFSNPAAHKRALTPPFEQASDTRAVDIRTQLNFVFNEREKLSVPQNTVKPDLEGAEVMIVGPGISREEIRSFVESFQGKIKAVHVLDARQDVMRSVDSELDKYRKAGGQLPPVYGYVANMLEMPKELSGHIDVIYMNNVVDRNYISQGQLQQLSNEIKRTLKTGGVFITTGIFPDWMDTVETDGMEKGRSFEGRNLLGFGYAIKTASSQLVGTDNKDVGGIDLTEKNMNLDLRGQAGTFTMPADPAQVQSIHIDGLVPVILNVTPLPSLPVFLKLSQAQTPGPAQLSLQN